MNIITSVIQLALQPAVISKKIQIVWLIQNFIHRLQSAGGRQRS